MRPALVLIILALALLSTVFIQTEKRGSFDERFDRADERLREMAQSIDEQIEPANDD